jgi:hypothetical protein
MGFFAASRSRERAVRAAKANEWTDIVFVPQITHPDIASSKWMWTLLEEGRKSKRH